MNPAKVERSSVRTLTDLPNIGPAMAADLRLLGFAAPAQLTGACPFTMYEQLCALTRTHQDPCVLDVFISVTDFLQGNPPRPWWAFSSTRKQALAERSKA